MLRPLFYLSAAACAQLVAAAGSFSVSQGKLSIIDSVASSASHTSTFSSDSTPSPPLREVVLSSTDTIKLSFQVTDGETSQPVQPQQAIVSWQPVDEREKREYGKQFAAVVKVRNNGKARWELDLARAPTSLLSLSKSPISLTLLLGSAKYKGLSIPLGTFQLSESLALPFPYPPNEDLPAHWEVEKYSQQPRIDWTFRPAEKRVGTVVSALGLGMVLAPWVVLLSVLSYLRPSLSLRSPTLSQSILLVSLVSFEALFVTYWVKLRLIPTLPYFALLSGVVVLSGKKALGEMRTARLERERKEMGKTE
ncbi:uncharacterized protein JCM6883_001844 [Sporobolomyces salmoneus]|uniref:uncharacterized protein n=1 Tax=Sporobolomyces salmoneus TaxID=183962 RepID=UPI00316F8B10